MEINERDLTISEESEFHSIDETRARLGEWNRLDILARQMKGEFLTLLRRNLISSGLRNFPTVPHTRKPSDLEETVEERARKKRAVSKSNEITFNNPYRFR
ncbi:MAG: hypothetical protein AAGF53_02475 [Pseudomonadota bacterium]